MDSNNTKYQSLMANLLNIDTYDSSLFSTIDNERYFDIYKNFGESTFEEIYNKFNFNCVLAEAANRAIAEKVNEAKNKTEIINIFKDYNKRLDDHIFKMLTSNLEKARSLIIAQQETEFQKSIVKWKKILNKAQNINIETNIWPLHIGFFYISIKTENKTIYAPLFFKEIMVEIKNSLVYISSNSDIRVNSKLVTFLNQEGFSLDVDSFDFSGLSIREVFEKLKEIWSPLFSLPDNLRQGIKNLNVESIKNTSIMFHSGIVLGFFNVSSGYLWNQMKKIIENDEFDKILQPNVNKNVYRQKVQKVIFDDNFKLFKIQETNYSQDVATVSSLYQDTIIWGPPGTGKSQTISNLITNIIARGYTALVVSQKKAALDVLKNRMKKLSIFCLFALNDKHLRLETFYEPLKEFIYLIENYQKTEREEGFSVFSDEDKNYVDNVNLIKRTPNLNNIINFYASIMNGNFSEKTYDSLKQLDTSLKYNFSNVIGDRKEIIKQLYELNLKKKHWIFSIVPGNIKRMADVLLQDESLFTIDINQALKYVNLVTYEEIMNFSEQYKKILISKTVKLNDDKRLTKILLEKTFEKINNFSEEQKRQYTAFAMAIRIGSLKPYKFFHKHKEMIKLLFPIIVTTPELDLSMWQKEEFDYAILDESSQVFLEKGIPILYLAKRKILAGDNQQMQPTRWFSASYSFDEEDDFGNIKSLLDYAMVLGVYSVLLDKNYRSKKATLMTFSSKHFYESKLDVIDNYELSLENDKAIEVIQVDGKWDNSMNEQEGKTVIELVRQNLSKYKKIIILLFNSKQQDYLMNNIFGIEPVLEEALMNEQIIIKNIENVQGDEADLVIMSVVYDKNTSLQNTYVARNGGKNALNVAISRAREKVMVVKSIYAEDIEISEKSTADMIMFRDWLKFLDLSLEQQKNYLDETNDFLATRIQAIPEDLKFKVDVIDDLKKLIVNKPDFRFELNYSVGTKTIDIVLINKINKKMVQGFILDNFAYKNDYQKYLVFMDSIKFLESKEYPIIYVSEIEWPINKDKIFNYLRMIIEEETRSNEQIKNPIDPPLFVTKTLTINDVAYKSDEPVSDIKIEDVISEKESNIDSSSESDENNDDSEEIDDYAVDYSQDKAELSKEIDSFEDENLGENPAGEVDEMDVLSDEFKTEEISFNNNFEELNSNISDSNSVELEDDENDDSHSNLSKDILEEEQLESNEETSEYEYFNFDGLNNTNESTKEIVPSNLDMEKTTELDFNEILKENNLEELPTTSVSGDTKNIKIEVLPDIDEQDTHNIDISDINEDTKTTEFEVKVEK
ncbi:DEAD/DEAH box helicase [Mycoplasma enhydrae]|uniref:DEAD/DEAH box helicase n=1 Tax=Mycoplasma enhydrae TaxID=2499220 RepID=UPI00197B839C|nr:DEAD/DEAH box helicase [Mycoplasma enhydrae]MBN4089260.1 DNA2/NAM7 family helicase [Mycoplasma enhydrae]